MSTIADLWKAYLTGEGYTFSSLQDTVRQALLVETGRSTGSIQELWKAYLEAEGYDGAVPDMMKKWLVAKGYDGTVQDMLKKALRDGDIFEEDVVIGCAITLSGDIAPAFGGTSMTIDGQSASTDNTAVRGVNNVPTALDWAPAEGTEYRMIEALVTVDGPATMLAMSDNLATEEDTIPIAGAGTYRIAIIIEGSASGYAAINRIDGVAGSAYILNPTDFALCGFNTADGVATCNMTIEYRTDGSQITPNLYPAGVLDWCGQDTITPA